MSTVEVDQIASRLSKYQRSTHSYHALLRMLQNDENACKNFIDTLYYKKKVLRSDTHSKFLTVFRKIGLDFKMTSCNRAMPNSLAYTVILPTAVPAPKKRKAPLQRRAVAWKLIHCLIQAFLSPLWIEQVRRLDEVPRFLVKACTRCGEKGQDLLDYVSKGASECFKLVHEQLDCRERERKTRKRKAAVLQLTPEKRARLQNDEKERTERRLLLTSITLAHAFISSHLKEMDVSDDDGEEVDGLTRYSGRSARGSHSIVDEVTHYLVLTLTSDDSVRSALDLDFMHSTFTHGEKKAFMKDMSRIIKRGREYVYHMSAPARAAHTRAAQKLGLLPSRSPVSRRSMQADVIFFPQKEVNGWIYEDAITLPASVVIRELHLNTASQVDYIRATEYMKRLHARNRRDRHAIVLVFSGMKAAYRVRQALETARGIYPDMIHMFEEALWLQGANTPQDRGSLTKKAQKKLATARTNWETDKREWKEEKERNPALPPFKLWRRKNVKERRERKRWTKERRQHPPAAEQQGQQAAERKQRLENKEKMTPVQLTAWEKERAEHWAQYWSQQFNDWRQKEAEQLVHYPEEVAAEAAAVAAIADTKIWRPAIPKLQEKDQVYLFITCQQLFCVRNLLIGYMSERWPRLKNRVLMAPLLTRSFCCEPSMTITSMVRNDGERDNLLFNVARYSALRTLLSWTTSHLHLEARILKPHNPLFYYYTHVPRIIQRWGGRDNISEEISTLILCSEHKYRVEQYQKKYGDEVVLPSELQNVPPERPPHKERTDKTCCVSMSSSLGAPDVDGAAESDDEEDIIDGGYGSDTSRMELPHDRPTSSSARFTYRKKARNVRRWKSDPAEERNLLGILVDFITGTRRMHMMVTYKLRHIFVYTLQHLNWTEKFKKYYPELLIFIQTVDYYIQPQHFETSHILIQLDPKNAKQQALFPTLPAAAEKNMVLTMHLYMALCDDRLFSDATARNLLRGIHLAYQEDHIELRTPQTVCRKKKLPLEIIKKLQNYSSCCTLSFADEQRDSAGMPNMNVSVSEYNSMCARKRKLDKEAENVPADQKGKVPPPPHEYDAAYWFRMSYNSHTTDIEKQRELVRFHELMECLEWSIFYKNVDIEQNMLKRYCSGLANRESKQNWRGHTASTEKNPLGMPIGPSTMDPTMLVSTKRGVSLMAAVTDSRKTIYSHSGLPIPPLCNAPEQIKLRNMIACYDREGAHLIPKQESVDNDLYDTAERHHKRKCELARRQRCLQHADENHHSLLLRSQFPAKPFSINIDPARIVAMQTEN